MLIGPSPALLSHQRLRSNASVPEILRLKEISMSFSLNSLCRMGTCFVFLLQCSRMSHLPEMLASKYAGADESVASSGLKLEDIAFSYTDHIALVIQKLP